MRVAMWTAPGAIGLSIAFRFLSAVIDGDSAETGYHVVMLIGIPAFPLLLPVLILAAVVDRAGRRTYPRRPIVASWDVHLDGAVHVVSVPDPVSSPDHVCIDGARIPLVWMPTGEWSARAAPDGGTWWGTLSRGNNVVEFVSLVMGSYPMPFCSLRVKGATVEAIPVTDEERRS
jgi:hypothetical protein